jgi:glycosyltransferase involved in cell wall biosynthesis
MRITIVNQFYPPDLAPTGHLAASLAEHRAALGDTVTVITSIGGYVPQPQAKGPVLSDNPRVIRLWTPMFGKKHPLQRIVDYFLFFIQAVFRLKLLSPQDLLISLTTPPFIAVAAAAHKAIHPRAKLVLWNMDCYPEILERTGTIPPGGFVSRALQRINRIVFSRLDLLVCLDEAMSSLLKSRYPSLAGVSSTVIPNWEALALFPPGRDIQPWPGWDVLPASAALKVLYLGNAGFGHSFDTLLEAASTLRQDEVEFLFVGGGSKWPELARQADRRGLENLHLHPYVAKEATPSVLAGADCALITMNESALGVISPSKLHAYLAMGLPVLYIGPEGSNVDGAIRNFGIGATLRHGDAQGVVRFLRALATNKDLLVGFRKQARSAFETAYSDSQTLPLFDAAIRGLKGD